MIKIPKLQTTPGRDHVALVHPQPQRPAETHADQSGGQDEEQEGLVGLQGSKARGRCPLDPHQGPGPWIAITQEEGVGIKADEAGVGTNFTDRPYPDAFTLNTGVLRASP